MVAAAWNSARSRWSVLFLITALIGIAIRVWDYRSPLGLPNSDDATVGLMALHATHGQLVTFMWGLPYGGSQEALLATPGFLIAGSSWLVLRLVPMVLIPVAVFLVWRVGRRTVGEPGATAGAALFTVWPAYIAYQTEGTGFYASNLVYCALLILLALRIVETPSRLRVGLFGFVLGLAFWQTTQIVPIALIVVSWTVVRRPAALRSVWVAAPLLLLGALPWLYWNVTHHWNSLAIGSGAEPTSYLYRLRLFFSPVLPELLGLRTPLSQQRLLPGALTYLVYVALVALFAYGAVRSRRNATGLLYLIVAVFPFLYALAAQTYDSTTPRYALILAPVLVLLVGGAMTTWWRAALVLAVATALTIVSLHRMEHVPPVYELAPRNLTPLVTTLDRLHLNRVYANFWIAYVLDFDTQERIIAVEAKFDTVSFAHGRAVLPPDPVVHYRPYQRVLAAAVNPGFVFFRRALPSIPIVPALEHHGYRPVFVGPFVIFAPPRAG